MCGYSAEVKLVLRSDSRVLRALLLALLALAAVVQPMVGFASEIHEWQHDDSGGEAESGSHGHQHDEPSAPPDPLDPADRWHVLMHFAHCCGHCTALMPPSFGLDASTPGALSPRTDPGFPPSAESSLLLRPPIHG